MAARDQTRLGSGWVLTCKWNECCAYYLNTWNLGGSAGRLVAWPGIRRANDGRGVDDRLQFDGKREGEAATLRSGCWTAAEKAPGCDPWGICSAVGELSLPGDHFSSAVEHGGCLSELVLPDHVPVSFGGGRPDRRAADRVWCDPLPQCQESAQPASDPGRVCVVQHGSCFASDRDRADTDRRRDCGQGPDGSLHRILGARDQPAAGRVAIHFAPAGGPPDQVEGGVELDGGGGGVCASDVGAAFSGSTAMERGRPCLRRAIFLPVAGPHTHGQLYS